MNVRHFMTDEPVTCAADDRLQDAATLMDEHQVGSVVVLQDGKLAGVLTDRQVALALGARGAGLADPVSTVMTDEPARVTLDSNLFEVLDAMRGNGLPKRMPVVNAQDELVGLVSIDDMAVVADKLNQEVFRNYTHVSLEETEVPTGAKRIAGELRAPGKDGGSQPPKLEEPITVPHTEREHDRKST